MSSSQHRSAQRPRFTQHSYAQTTHKRTYHDSDATVGSSQIDANHITGIGTLPPPSTKDGMGGCRRRGAGVGRKRTGRTSAGEAAQAAGGKSEGHSTSCKDVRKRSPSFSIDLTSNWLDMPCGAQVIMNVTSGRGRTAQIVEEKAKFAAGTDRTDDGRTVCLVLRGEVRGVPIEFAMPCHVAIIPSVSGPP